MIEPLLEPGATAALLVAMGLLMLLASLASPLPGRAGVPALTFFLLVGMLAGSEGIGGLPFHDYALAFTLGTTALVLILFDGGLNTSLGTFRAAALRASILATFSVAATAALVAGAGLLLGLSPPLAILVGAVVSSTDAAAVFSVLRTSGVRLQERTGATLEVESGLNDPMAAFLTIAVTEWILGGGGEASSVALMFGSQALFGVLGGVGWGLLGRRLLGAVPLPAAGLYPVATAGLALLSFGSVTLAGGSGFLAVYLTGILLAAGAIPYRPGVRRVHDSLAWLAQIGMFVLLGLLVVPSKLVPEIGRGIGLALALALVARPLAVGIVLAPFGLPWRELAFVSWVGLRGAVPIILATYPVLRGVAEGDQLFHLVFFVVLVNSLVPGATVGILARWLGLARPGRAHPPATIEMVSLRELSGEFVWYDVAEVSAVAGAQVRDLALPDECVAVLVLRGDRVIAPRGDTRLDPGDQVCIFVTEDVRRLLDLLFGGEAGSEP